MVGNVGDTIVIESERADATGRRGVIEAVFQEQPFMRAGLDDDRVASGEPLVHDHLIPA
jgi:hypothetical protein